MSTSFDLNAEWLETDGLGGFASGTVGGIRTRRYHALLLAATTPPTGRMVLVNGFEAWVETGERLESLSSHLYGPGVVHPDGRRRLTAFDRDPWPRWTYTLDDGASIVHEVSALHGQPGVLVSWRLLTRGTERRVLTVRPLLSGRDYHALHRENPSFRFEGRSDPGGILWQPYPDVPAVQSLSNATYEHKPEWYRNFLYQAERDRGLDDTEDLASPGVLRFDLSKEPAFWLLTAGAWTATADAFGGATFVDYATALRSTEEVRRAAFVSPLERAADSYLVRRATGMTVVAGYPWFTDWGRDTFIALRGLCLATGRVADARDIVLEWAGAVSEGMVPNRFPDNSGVEPEFNAVDASLWFVVACGDLMAADDQTILSGDDRRRLRDAISNIVEGYARGTRYGIRADADGLLRAGEPGVQLTWMDARVGSRVVTPRVGKPVEVQALWLNALAVACAHDPRWQSLFDLGMEAFPRRFWNRERSCLYDVVDVDHVAGRVDPSIRPNQILAVGGLPLAIFGGPRARLAVETVEQNLLTPVGLRSLAPNEPGYVGRYRGGVSERDGAYHQGTVWPWLMGPFVDAWLRTHGDDEQVRAEARRRFVLPLLRHLDEAGLGHVSEVADGDSPHTPGGCPFQAWSVAELVRLEKAIVPVTPRQASSETADPRRPASAA